MPPTHARPVVPTFKAMQRSGSLNTLVTARLRKDARGKSACHHLLGPMNELTYGTGFSASKRSAVVLYDLDSPVDNAEERDLMQRVSERARPGPRHASTVEHHL